MSYRDRVFRGTLAGLGMVAAVGLILAGRSDAMASEPTAEAAKKQLQDFGGLDETNPVMKKQIKSYWEGIGLAFPGVSRAWSAVFVSWCVKQSGATAQEFRFAPQHSMFAYQAIKNQLHGTGVFRAHKISDYAPQVGDIIQNNRPGVAYDYQYASTHPNYLSHSAIVVQKTTNAAGKPMVVTIGGNEGNQIRKKEILLDASGKIIPRSQSPFICVIENQKY